MSSEPAREFSIWLMPEQEAHLRLQQVVNELARKYDTPTFDPHLTLFWGSHTPDLDPRSFSEQISGQGSCPELELTPRKIWYEPDIRTQAMFLEFQADEQIAQWQRGLLAEGFGEMRSTQGTPLHVSLQYSDFDVDRKAQIRLDLLKEFEGLDRVAFDRVRVIGTKQPTDTLTDLSTWVVGDDISL